MKSVTPDRRFELACEIIKRWQLEQIVNHAMSAEGAVDLALTMAALLVQRAHERGWIDAD